MTIKGTDFHELSTPKEVTQYGREEPQKSIPSAPKLRTLRVLHVINVRSSNYYLNNLVDFTDETEVQLSFVTLNAKGGFVEDLTHRGVNAYALDCETRSRYLRAAKEISRIINNDQIDIVHTHLFDPTVIGLIVAKRRRCPVIVTRHHSDALYSIRNKLKRQAYLSIERFINRNAAHFIAPSRAVRDILIKEGVSSDRISLIPYGQTAERFDTIPSSAVERIRSELVSEGQLALVCVSRLYERKGHRYLFEAFESLLKNGLKAKLLLVGEGPHKDQLSNLVRELGIDEHVHFLGWRDDAKIIMAAADIIVHPSLEDALSSAVIEALMLERPIIATDISGVRDSLGDGEYGMIAPPADAEAFRAALEQVISNLEAARERARRGRKYLLEYMDAGRVAAQYAACYYKIIYNQTPAITKSRSVEPVQG